MSTVSQMEAAAVVWQEAAQTGTKAKDRKADVAQGTNETQGTTETEKNGKITGRTIGNPKLSEKAAKYYEELKQKYGNMDFVLVSSDQKEFAKSIASSFNNPHRMVVLIDDEKIERMAEDEEFRKQYEAVLSNAASGISQLKARMEKSGANVKAYGAKINDGGTMSFFAVVDKSLKAQQKRIQEKREEKKEARKAADKKAEKKEKQEKLEERRAEKASGEELVTVTASSVDELMRKIDDVYFESRSDNVQTEEERQIGQFIDFKM